MNGKPSPSDYWDQRYAGADYIFGTEPSQFVARHAHHLASGSALLLPADGEGRNSVFLAGLGHRVTASDYCEIALEKARRLAAENDANIDFQVADLASWTWPENAYDAVVAVFIQFAAPDMRARLFAAMKRAVHPGGLVLLHGYTPKQIDYGTGGSRQVENLYTEDLLRQAFGDFEILELKAYDADLSEGAGHAGRSALIDLVARRPL
jgi:SAM-dependent methyltransferase